MNPEKLEGEVSATEVNYDRRTSALKASIQTAIITRFIEGDTSNQRQKRTKKWIDACSSDFRGIFKKRILHEEGFLDRCEREPNEVVEEITAELRLLHEFPTVLTEEELKVEELV